MPPETAAGSRFLSGRPGTILFVLVVTAAGFLVPAVVPGPTGGFVALAVMLSLIFGGLALKGSGPSALGLRRPSSWARTLALSALYAVVAFVLFRLLLEGLFEQLTGVERDLSRFAGLEGNAGALLREIPLIWMSAAFFEEVYFRGFLILQIASLTRRRVLGLWIGTLLSSLLFAFVHGYQSSSGALLTGAGAFFLAWIFLRHERNLWIPIIVHGLHDTSGLVFVYLGIYDRLTGLFF